MKWSDDFMKTLLILAGLALIVLSFSFYAYMLPLAMFIGILLIMLPFHRQRQATIKSLLLPGIILFVQIFMITAYLDLLSWLGFVLFVLFPVYILVYIALSYSFLTVYKSEKRYGLKLAVSMMVIIFFVLHMNAYVIGKRIKLAYVLPRCKSIIVEVENGKYVPGREYKKKGLIFSIEKERPLKVVFVFTAGVVDNWTGVVYDPDKCVERLTGLKSDLSEIDERRLEDVIKLFGGDMYNCEIIEKSWYLCDFT